MKVPFSAVSRKQPRVERGRSTILRKRTQFYSVSVTTRQDLPVRAFQTLSFVLFSLCKKADKAAPHQRACAAALCSASLRFGSSQPAFLYRSK